MSEYGLCKLELSAIELLRTIMPLPLAGDLKSMRFHKQANFNFRPSGKIAEYYHLQKSLSKSLGYLVGQPLIALGIDRGSTHVRMAKQRTGGFIVENLSRSGRCGMA